MNTFAERQLLIEPSRFSYKMWKDVPVDMYQSFTFFNLTNWNQVKSVGQKPRFEEVGPYVYKTIWTKSDINFIEEDTQVTFAGRKQWIFQPHLSNGFEEDQIWTINTPLMTALALIQNAPVITRNIVSVILDGLGEGAFIKRNIKSLLFEGYSDLIVSVGPLFDRRFANFNGKFAYLYNKNDTIDGLWTVSTGTDDISTLNKILRFQSTIFNMSTFTPGQHPQGLNEVKPECAAAWSLDQATNGQLFSPFDEMDLKVPESPSQSHHHSTSNGQQRAKPRSDTPATPSRRFFSRNGGHDHANHISQPQHQPQDLVPNPFISQKSSDQIDRQQMSVGQDKNHLKDTGKYIFYPDLCRPIHLLPGNEEVVTADGIKAYRYYIDTKIFMNSSQVPANRCYEMNPRPPLANALAATISSVTGANVAMPNLVAGASSPFAMFSPVNAHHQNSDNNAAGSGGNIFERANHPTSFLNHALQSLGAGQSSVTNPDHANSNGPLARLGRVRQLFSNIVSQRMTSSGPGSLLPSLSSNSGGMLMGNHLSQSIARNSQDDNLGGSLLRRQSVPALEARQSSEAIRTGASQPTPVQVNPPTAPVGSDRWITQFRFKWPRGVFSIGQCQLGAPIYASLPHFLDADEYYLEQVDGLKPNRSLHEFYIDVESSIRAVPVGAKARLQLNVATPELRFRNIPNAMIPVLWQEVTFEMSKPIATMLYWSFTMSGTLYKLTSVILIVLGLVLMVASLVGGFKRKKNDDIPDLSFRSGHQETIKKRRSPSKVESSSRIRRQEGERSSWQPHMINSREVRVSADPRRLCHSLQNSRYRGNSGSSDTLSDSKHGGAVNRAFVGCAGEFHDRMDSSAQHSLRSHHCGVQSSNLSSLETSSGPPSGGSMNAPGGSPKQPSSRASSHCELVSNAGNNATMNCTGCLLACLRHSPSNSVAPQHTLALQGGTCIDDGSIVRDGVDGGNADKATL